LLRLSQFGIEARAVYSCTRNAYASPIDEPTPEARRTETDLEAERSSDRNHFGKETSMNTKNAKLLYAATVALALTGTTCAMADEGAPLPRAAVVPEYQQAARAGTLHRNDWSDELAARPQIAEPRTREAVIADMAAYRADRRRLLGPLRDRSYNPYGTGIFSTSTLARTDVKAEVLEARSEGTLRPAGEQDEVRSVARVHRSAPSIFAGRIGTRGS
jgi:hypothetical protein